MVACARHTSDFQFGQIWHRIFFPVQNKYDDKSYVLWDVMQLTANFLTEYRAISIGDEWITSKGRRNIAS